MAAGIDLLIARHARAIATSPGGFYQDAVYLVGGTTPKTIRAAIDLSGPTPMPEDRHTRTPRARVIVPILDDIGLTAVQEGRDKITLKLRPGDAGTTTCVVRQLVEENRGFFTLEVSK